jgi:hypothetical protein
VRPGNGEDDFQDLEGCLRRLPLRRPSGELDARIASVGAAPSAHRPRRRLAAVVAAAAAVAAGLALVALWRPWQPDAGQAPTAARVEPVPAPASKGTTPPVSRPVRVEQVWSAVSNEGVVSAGDVPPMQRFQRQVIRSVRVIDEDRHVRIEWNIPSRQTVLMPLEYN